MSTDSDFYYKTYMSLTKTPEGKYTFVGSVPTTLAFICNIVEFKNCVNAKNHWNPKPRYFNTKEEAINAARENGIISIKICE